MHLKRFAAFALAAASGCAYIATRPAEVPDRPGLFDPALRMPAEVRTIVTRACADCHTAGTRWPWYARIPPGSWLVHRDVARARKAMDFTDWSSRNGRKLGIARATLTAACADVQSGRMPLPQYLWMHPDARLAPHEIQRFCAWTAMAAPR